MRCRGNGNPAPRQAQYERTDMQRQSTSMRKRIFCFDPTIHAGHLVTAATVLCSTVFAWATMNADLKTLTDENNKRVQEIKEARTHEEEDRDRLEQKIVETQNAMHSEIVELKNDQNAWFMRIDQKIDNKADKK